MTLSASLKSRGPSKTSLYQHGLKHPKPEDVELEIQNDLYDDVIYNLSAPMEDRYLALVLSYVGHFYSTGVEKVYLVPSVPPNTEVFFILISNLYVFADEDVDTALYITLPKDTPFNGTPFTITMVHASDAELDRIKAGTLKLPANFGPLSEATEM